MKKPVDYPCDLCGQPVKVPGFQLHTPYDGAKKFCCEGCLSIFQLLNPQTTTHNNNKENPS